MASPETNPTINGTYGSAYNGVVNVNNTVGHGTGQSQAANANTGATPEQIPKDEVGWYFVEQYYTTLSKTPDKLYLFYNKRSQYVSGTEEDKVNVCVGQKAINDRIKELLFHDTKVRVTNVDSQGSDNNIVIQVIGEISNQGQPHKRFVQTFILAAQTNGYFVLNDIFRYLADDPEDAPEIIQHESDLATVSQKLEDVAKQEAVVEPEQSLPTPENKPTVAAPELPAAEETPAIVESAEEEPSNQEPEVTIAAPVVDKEVPQDPPPTPAPTASKATATSSPAAPPKPAVPRTWASLAASAATKVALPIVPSAATSQPPAQAKSTTATTAPSQNASAPSPAPAQDTTPVNEQNEASGWQTAGHKKEPVRTQTQPTVEPEQKRAYIKNVYSQVEEGALKTALSQFGEITYLDISRQKNCAFVDFGSAAAFQAAVNSNPHTVNGIELKVEERRMRPQQPFNYPRGGAQRGRGGVGGPNRGGFPPRGGRGSLGRGRPAPQEA